MPVSASTKAHELPGKQFLGIFAFQAVALAIAAWVNRHALNPDGVAYLRIASYYATGKTDLAISGYWGPLISWLMMPWLKSGVTPLATARIVMALSAILFLLGCWRVFRSFGLSGKSLCSGIWISAIVSIPWSVENITPDLLLSALISFAVAGMVGERWLEKSFVAFVSGMWWGAAYVCKAIALPLAAIVICGFAVIWLRRRPVDSKRIIVSSALTILGVALVSIPWIKIISSQSGKLTISRSALLNHSLVGPGVVNRLYVLDQGFHQPAASRVTSWEDPAPPYPDWSPLASWSNAARQIEIIAKNIPIVLVMLIGVSLSVPFLVALPIWQWLRRRAPTFGSYSTELTAALLVIGLAVLFLPNYVLITEQRYFYPAFPFLYVLSVALLRGMTNGPRSWIQRSSTALLVLTFLAPTFARVLIRPGSSRMAGECAYLLAQKVRSAHLSGSVAGSGRLPGGRTGLYLAFHLNQPWFGDEPSATAESFRNSGARLVVVNRGSAVARELEASADFRSTDQQLFGSSDEARQFPLEIFESASPRDSSAF